MQDKEGVPPHTYRVGLAGRSLEDTDSVSSTAIGKDSCLHMMGRLIGGTTTGLGPRLFGSQSERTTITLDAFRESKFHLKVFDF